MKDEIKEILEELKDEDNYIEDYGFRYKRIALDDVWHLLDYITNLQEENKKLKELKNLYREKFISKFCANNRAIEYIKKHTNNFAEYLDVYETKELSNILQGSDKDA